MNRGWLSLVFVQLEKTSVLPKWLPGTHIRFSAEDYTIDQLVGAIKVRVQEQGGSIVQPDAMAEAKRVRREATYLADRESLMRSAFRLREHGNRVAAADLQSRRRPRI